MLLKISVTAGLRLVPKQVTITEESHEQQNRDPQYCRGKLRDCRNQLFRKFMPTPDPFAGDSEWNCRTDDDNCLNRGSDDQPGNDEWLCSQSFSKILCVCTRKKAGQIFTLTIMLQLMPEMQTSLLNT